MSSSKLIIKKYDLCKHKKKQYVRLGSGKNIIKISMTFDLEKSMNLAFSVYFSFYPSSKESFKLTSLFVECNTWMQCQYLYLIK